MSAPIASGGLRLQEPDPQFGTEIMGDFRAAVQLMEAAVAEIRQGWEDLVAAVNDLLRRVDEWLSSDSVWATIVEWWNEDIHDAVKALRKLVPQIGEKVSALLDKAEKSIRGSVPVLSLFEVALDWAVKVDPLLSDLGPDMTGSGKIDSWRGPAKLTYEKRVQDQMDAVDSCVQKVKATSSWLAGVAQENTTYMVDSAKHVTAVLNPLTTAIIDISETAAGAVTQAPLALQDFSEVIGTAVQELADAALELGQRLSTVMAQIVNLAGEYGDHSGLPGGDWPKSVND